MTYVDKILTCVQCSAEFVFSAGEQQFFADKEYKSDPKRCKQCRMKRNDKPNVSRQETKVICAECGQDTTVPFKPVRGKPVLCHLCFKKSKQTLGPRLVITGHAGTGSIGSNLR